MYYPYDFHLQRSSGNLFPPKKKNPIFILSENRAGDTLKIYLEVILCQWYTENLLKKSLLKIPEWNETRPCAKETFQHQLVLSWKTHIFNIAETSSKTYLLFLGPESIQASVKY